LDNVSSNVTVADQAHQVIYVNDTARALFASAEADIRRDLPGFSAAGLVGSDLGQLHRDPARQRQMLDALNAPHTEEFLLGGRTLRLVANPVVDASGERLGSVIEWTDRTDEVAVEREIDGIVEAAQAGDLTQRIDMHGKTGFFAELGSGINALIDEIEKVFTDIAHVMGFLAKGDLTRPITAEYAGTFGDVRNDINASLAHLRDVLWQLRENTDMMSTAADEISSGNNNLSARTEQQASSLQETAASMEELTSTVRHNASNAQQANQMATGARQHAEHGGDVVHRAVEAMQQIETASGRIAEIIGVIDDIAFQTNLLALNASVEAAPWIPPKPPLLITSTWSPGRALATTSATMAGMASITSAGGRVPAATRARSMPMSGGAYSHRASAWAREGARLSWCTPRRMVLERGSSTARMRALPTRRRRPFQGGGDGGGMVGEIIIDGDVIHHAAHLHAPLHAGELAQGRAGLRRRHARMAGGGDGGQGVVQVVGAQLLPLHPPLHPALEQHLEIAPSSTSRRAVHWAG
jgi:hypothetical protein